MKDTLIVGAMLGACALLGNVAGGYIIANRLASLSATPAGSFPANSAEAAIGRLRADPSLRRARHA
jgi:hypothetical protein